MFSTCFLPTVDSSSTVLLAKPVTAAGKLPVINKNTPLRLPPDTPTILPKTFERPASSSATSAAPHDKRDRPIAYAFTGHGNSHTMRTANVFRFFCTQLMFSTCFLPTVDSSSTVLLAKPVRAAGKLPVINKNTPLRLPPDTPTILPKTFERPASSSATSAAPHDKRDRPIAYAFTGHGNSHTMRTADVFRFFCTQVSNIDSLYTKKSSDVFLLVFPCPRELFSIVGQSIDVVKFLMLCGDVEVNPGPETRNKQLDDMCKLLQDGQSKLLMVVNEIKTNQQQLEDKITDISNRLQNVETKTNVLDRLDCEVRTTHQVLEEVKKENAFLRARLDDLEDRSRRDNLIFHGIDDSPSETWAQSEQKVHSLLSNVPELSISEEGITRAHRLGTFSRNKCRPVMVKLVSTKTKESILSAKAKLKTWNVSVNEDFAPATRYARKKLFDFAKSQSPNSIFKIRYNRLHLNKKCYAYCSTSDEVYEISSATSATDRGAESLQPQHVQSATS
ncbi:uncharacterized protein LOC115329344 [Ixodes scapularis]|uniref:uncharacterized protein LOC115329344 n=1 Tax=Ixodes scapularis TaxID=6945 RepID=UPI001A9D7F14|nr:uncharacterized protein LOC115329344 [Ixodes scapularis]